MSDGIALEVQIRAAEGAVYLSGTGDTCIVMMDAL